jgi:hypothetical protein
MNNILKINKICITNIDNSLQELSNFISTDYKRINYKNSDNITIIEKLIEFFINHNITYCLNLERVDDIDNSFDDKSLYGIIKKKKY